MASDEEIRRMIKEIHELRKQIRNLKLKVKRRTKKLQMTFSPLERQRLEFDIELLKQKMHRWETVENKLSIPLLKGRTDIFDKELGAGVDWSKAGRA